MAKTKVDLLFEAAQRFVRERAGEYTDLAPEDISLSLGCHLAEKDHKESSRIYAHTFHVPATVCVCRAINELPPEHIWGILLHEFGHIYGGDQESDADLWVEEELGVDLLYVDTIQWGDPPEGVL